MRGTCRLGTQLEYSVFFMPRRTMVCEKVFQDEGVVADVTLAEYPLDFIPFDSDILTLELDSAYKVCAVSRKLQAALHPPTASFADFLFCAPLMGPPADRHVQLSHCLLIWCLLDLCHA